MCVRYYAENCGYNTLRTPWLFDRFYPNAPVVLEFEHYQSVAMEIFKNGYPFMDAMQRTHATFAGFHGYPRPWLEREPWLTAYAANRLGYWFFVDGIELPTMLAGVKNRVKLHLANRGYAASYRKYDLKLRLAGENGCHTETLDADCRRWDAGEAVVENVTVQPMVPAGQYSVEIGLFEGERPIELALRKDLQTADGFYRIGETEVTEI